MARTTLPLTDTQIKAAKLTDKDYSSFDGGGIYLLIRANNFEMLRIKYKRPYTKKEALLSFGSYFEVSVQQARNLIDQAQELIKPGIDPQEHKAEQYQFQ